MAVAFANEPKGSRAALADGLRALGSAGTHTAAAHSAAVRGAEAPPPLPVYSFPLDALIAGTDPRSESPVAWKYLLVSGGQPVRAAEVIAADPNGAFAFAAISAAEATAINRAIETAENDPVIAKGDFELRLALVPALYVTALWLKDTAKAQDRFVVIPPAPNAFPPYSIHTASDFLTVLHRAALQNRRTAPQPGQPPTN